MNLENFAQAVSNDSKNGYGITVPWEMIMDLIMQLIQNCPSNAKDLTKMAKTPSVMQKSVMRNNIRKANPNMRWAEANRVADQVFAQAAELEDNQLEAAFHEVKAANAPLDYDMGV